MTEALAQQAEGSFGAWHALMAEQVLTELGTTPSGLPSAEAQRRRPVGAGPEAGPDQEGFLEELLESFAEPLQLLLIVVAVLSAVFGELRDAFAIGVIVVLVAVVETVTETRSARAIAALGRLAAPTARVLRDGRLVQVPATDLVSGDVVDVEAGDVVPARPAGRGGERAAGG